ncbi:UNVERIFIED_CONTAM: hypothetical protein Sangu_0067000 [Sesamum angustifolium]|uniref:Ankyrin repeat-containing protein BDA1-like n=1 Tax=Sesamum angustifolium TaxID=2727405 RepID=A0AAW2RIN1_9LAMI
MCNVIMQSPSLDIAASPRLSGLIHQRHSDLKHENGNSFVLLASCVDSRLFEAAQTGNAELLLDAIRSDPLILRKAAISSTAGDSALHIACLAGHIYFMHEFLKHVREFTRELNQDGLSPIHIAAATGNIEILQELLKVDIGLCFIRGKERRIPLHYASMKGHVDVVKESVLAGVGSIEMVTSRGETALHLAVKNNKFDVLKDLIEHIESSNNLGDVLNKKDEQGNTILHLAAVKKQHEVIWQLELVTHLQRCKVEDYEPWTTCEDRQLSHSDVQ